MMFVRNIYNKIYHVAKKINSCKFQDGNLNTPRYMSTFARFIGAPKLIGKRTVAEQTRLCCLIIEDDIPGECSVINSTERHFSAGLK